MFLGHDIIFQGETHVGHKVHWIICSLSSPLHADYIGIHFRWFSMIWRYEYFKGSNSDKKWSKIATPRHNFSEQVHVLKLCMSIDDDDDQS
jgi:hypothetical protein